jgi:hypothetical protein
MSRSISYPAAAIHFALSCKVIYEACAIPQGMFRKTLLDHVETRMPAADKTRVRNNEAVPALLKRISQQDITVTDAALPCERST